MSAAPRTELAPMRDGARLATDVYLPAQSPAPALLVRTPYGRRRLEAIVYGHPRLYAARGYAVVCQDVRGRGDSEGEFRPFAQEGPDGHDAVEWVAAQPWCDGRVGMYGFSYPGFAQLAAAAERPPHLRAVAPAMTAADVRDEWLYEGGALRLAFVLWWACELGKDGAVRAGDEELLYEVLRLQGDLAAACREHSRRRSLPAALERAAPYAREWVSRAVDDEWWAGLSAVPGPAAVPGFFLAGWHDTFLEGTIAAYRRAAAGGPPMPRRPSEHDRIAS
jgi:putative CocE/NonD family hydrolase